MAAALVAKAILSRLVSFLHVRHCYLNFQHLSTRAACSRYYLSRCKLSNLTVEVFLPSRRAYSQRLTDKLKVPDHDLVC